MDVVLAAYREGRVPPEPLTWTKKENKFKKGVLLADPNGHVLEIFPPAFTVTSEGFVLPAVICLHDGCSWSATVRLLTKQ